MKSMLSVVAALVALHSCVAQAEHAALLREATKKDATIKLSAPRQRRLRDNTGVFADIYNAAVQSSHSTSTSYTKCRDRATGEVIVLGAKSPKSAKSCKSTTKAPSGTRAPGRSTKAPSLCDEAPAPSPLPPSPTPPGSTKAPKSRRSSDRLTVDDLTPRAKSSKSEGVYAHVDIPYCDEITGPTTTQLDGTCRDIANGVFTINDVVDRFELYVTVGGRDINELVDRGLDDIMARQIRLALARLSGCTDAQLARRRRLAESVFTAGEIQPLGNGMSEYSVCDSNGSTCMQMVSEIAVGGRKDEELYQELKAFEPTMLQQCQAVFGPDCRFVIISINRLPGSGGGDTNNNGDDNDDPNSITRGEQMSSESKGLGPGGYVGLAGAFLVLLFLLLCCIKRRRNQDKSFYTSDEDSKFVDERYFDDESSMSELPRDRLVHVVGEENSQYTGTSWGNKSRIKIEPIDAVPEEDELNSIEISPEGLPPDDPLSTAHAGTPTRFVKNEPYIPPDIGYDRDYMASDTVDL